MRRVVFFGMNGGYSCASLAALARGGVVPALVVRGEPKRPITLAPRFELARASGGWRELLGLGSKPKAVDVDAFERGPSGASTEEHFVHAELAPTAKGLGVDTISTDDANALRTRLAIAKLEPEAFVVAGFPHLLSSELLGLARRGGLNVHPGKLPEERGPSPVFWALKAGRTTIDYAIHVLDLGEDSGDVVSTGEVTFEPGLDAEEVHTRCALAAAPQLVRAVRGLLDGELVRTPQKQQDAARCPRPTFRDGRIDPSKPARDVFTFVAGCAEHYSLYSEHGGDRFFIRGAVSWDPTATLPFEYMLTGDHMVVRCNPGIVELELKEQGALFTAEYAEADH
jgi:methionyl-tRNA formyltransferase